MDNRRGDGYSQLLEPRRGVAFGKMLHTNIEDPNVGLEQKNETFWYKVLEQYNEQAKSNNFVDRTKNMLTGKWTPMNQEVARYGIQTQECLVILKDKHKWKNPDSTNARRNRGRVTDDEPELFGDDELSRPPDKQRIAKSQRYTNSTASSDSNPTMFQEMLQQMETRKLDPKEKNGAVGSRDDDES
ncbi:hypothetical protein Tco_1138924 [Tanacetum coccineum]